MIIYKKQNEMLYLNKMSSILTNLSVIQKLAKDLIQARQLNYSQQCLPYYIDQTKFTIDNIEDLKNISGHLLKSSLIRHRNSIHKQIQIQQTIHKNKKNNTFKNNQQNQQICNNSNSKCVVFLHGLGSSRLQALPLVDCLPKQYCLFAFDFAGSGKSQGDNITYGIRQSQDIGIILDYLRINKGIKQFIIWGRSMGAVATLLYSIKLAKNSKDILSSKNQLDRIKGLVIDSPFCDFRQITKFIGLKRINLPQFLIDFALNIIENSFNQLLKDPKRDNTIYNPFKIKLDQQIIQTKIPTIFLYSQVDQVVPKQHSQRIIKVYKSLFDKFVMQQCSHNQTRPKQIIEKVFESLKKFQSRINRFVGNQQINYRGLSRNNSVDMNDRGSRGVGRRGISVQSKQKQKSVFVIESNFTQQSQNPIKFSNVTINSYSSLKVQPKRQKISCNMTNISKNPYVNDNSPIINNNNTNKNQSPLKIRLSNKLNRQQMKISVQPRCQHIKQNNTRMNFYNTIEYDNSILQKRLLKNNGNQQESNKNLQKNNMKFRRHSQLNRKVQYQLNHTRYL